LLVAVHGGPGISHEPLQALEALAGPELAVVNYDQRGVGRSSGAVDGARVMSQALEDLGAVIDAHAEARVPVHLLGHSWGGLVAALMAARRPARVASLVLVDSIPPTSAELSTAMSGMRQRLHGFQLRGLVPADLSTPGSADEAQAALLAMLPIYFVDPRHPAARSLGGARLSRAANRATAAALVDYDVRAELARVSVPALHFISPVPFGLAMATAMADALPNVGPGGRIVLTDAGHLPFLERPAPFFAAVTQFLEQVATRTRAQHKPGETP
jgi:proline iminopeptidase